MIGFWGLIDALRQSLPLWRQVLVFIGLNTFLFIMVFKALKAWAEIEQEERQ